MIKTLTIDPTCHQAAALLAVLLVTGKSSFLPPGSLGLEGVTCGRDSVIRELGPSSQTTVPLLPFIICPAPHNFLDVHFEGHDRIHSGEGNRRLVSHACLQRFSLTRRPALCLFAAAGRILQVRAPLSVPMFEEEVRRDLLLCVGSLMSSSKSK